MKYYETFAFASLLSAGALFAGPVVTPVNDATTLANVLLGSGVTLSGTPNLTQAGPQSGTFTNGPSLLGFGSGIVLSSGNAVSAAGNYAGPNQPSTSEGGPGSAALSALIGGVTTNDASVLTFDFIPTSSTVYFSYVFASAEYPNFVNSEFNDVFGFFVNGKNYALIPGTNTPVSINNVNPGANSNYFNKYNTTGDPLPYGGETVPLTFSAPVNPGVANTISLGIADTSDSVLDSAVFIEGGTFSVVPPSEVPPSATPEPASIALMGVGLLGAAGVRVARRRQRR